jgi:hypothetical protein
MRLVVHGRRGQKKTIGNIAGVIEIEIIEIKGDEVMLAVTARGPEAVVPKEESNHVNMVFASGEAQPLEIERDDRRHMVSIAESISGALPLPDFRLTNAMSHERRCLEAIEDHARAARRSRQWIKNSGFSTVCGCSSDLNEILKNPRCDIAKMLVDEFRIAFARVEELKAATQEEDTCRQ